MFTARTLHRLITGLSSAGALALITVIGKHVSGLNAITVALLYLLVVLTVSALADLPCGIVVAVISGLLVNFYFLPPFRTLYIASPEDWVAFFAYIATAVVVSYFAATVRRRALAADRLKAQLSQLARLTSALVAAQPDTVTLELLTQELNRAFQLGYCAIYLFREPGTATLVSSGTRPSRAAADGGKPSSVPGTILEVIAEEGSAVRCLTLKDQGKTIGALVISHVPLSPESVEAMAALAALVARQSRAQV